MASPHYSIEFMKVTEHIQKANAPLFSFEILPPLKGQHISSIFNTIDQLREFDPAFIDVTYHREEFFYRELPNGLIEKHVVRKRPGTVGICAAIQNKYGIDCIPHVLCGGFTKEDTENFLIDMDFLGIDNVMALRGDAVKNETYFTPERGGHSYASELVAQITALNNGSYLDEQLQNTSSMDFCIGVAAYPEKHIEAPSMESDIHFLKKKIELGAEYIVTQMFFDNQRYFDFVKRCRESGIDVPIIPGIKPLTILKHLNLLPQRFKVDLPDQLVKQVIKCKDNKEVRQVGIEWCIQQSKELIKEGAPVIHYYSMGNGKVIESIAKEVF